MTEESDQPLEPDPDAPPAPPAEPELAHAEIVGPAVEQLREWGYRVEQAQAFTEEQVGERVDVYYVEGFGMAVYARSDDAAYWTALVDPAAHAERVAQQSETADETSLRWHDDPDNDFKLPEEQVAEVRERVAVTRELRAQQQETEDG